MSIFCFLDQFFFLGQFLLSCFFLRNSTLYSKRDNSHNLEMEVRNCWWYLGDVCCRQTVIGITVLHMLNLLI